MKSFFAKRFFKNAAFTCIIFVAFALPLFSQLPQGINYQAVARDASGTVLGNQNISTRFTVRSNSGTGTIVYRETKSVTTNQFGLFTHEVGKGSPTQGNFSSINWKSADMYLEVEIDAQGGTNYTSLGASQMLSVPYALSAPDEQELSWNDVTKTLTISGGNSVILPVSGGSVGPTGPQGLAGANGATGATGPQGLPGQQGAQGPQGATGPQGPAGSYSAGAGITISNNTISAMDADATNELQQISLTGNTLSLSNGGGSVTLPSGGGGFWTASGNNITNNNSGDVGIGTFAPAARLDVLGPIRISWALPGTYNDVAGMMRYHSPSQQFQGYNGTQWVNFGGSGWQATGNDLHNTNTGSVGVGTTTPTQKLDIAGGVRIGFTSSATPGAIRFNNNNSDFEGYNGTQWKSLTTSGNTLNGVNKGDMQYWNGSQWQLVPVGGYGKPLVLCDSVPTWGICKPKPVIFLSDPSGCNSTPGYAKFDVSLLYIGDYINTKGVCYSTHPNPTLNDSVKTTITSDIMIKGLSPNTTYYFRAFAENSNGVGYSDNVIQITTPALVVGAFYQGGIIYSVDCSGNHGLIIATDTVPYGPWGDYSCSSPDGDDGEINTISIVNSCSDPLSAANKCSQLIHNGYSDWYLPSISEVLSGTVTVGGDYQSVFTPSLFCQNCSIWTSNDPNPNSAYICMPHDMYYLITRDKVSFNASVYCVRKF